MPNAKILIEVRGGNIVSISSNSHKVDISVIDYDNDQAKEVEHDVDRVLDDKQMKRYVNKCLKDK